MTNQDIANFFNNTKVNIYGNHLLRDPQREAYEAICTHFSAMNEPCYIQLPVGCGKTGLMGITPFGNTGGRVLIISPNLTIRKTIYDELNIADPNCFYIKRDVFKPKDGPFLSELKQGANIHDCEEAHIVLANIQQFAGGSNRWYERFPADYFRMILVDEGHHNVATSWRKLFDYFKQARIVSYTATPLRSDGQLVIGERIYSFSYTRSMVMGYISAIDSIHVAPTKITFTAKGETRTLSLEEVLKMREKDWFSRGIAMSEQCNRNIVQASIQQLNEVRKHGSPRMIIASAISIRHAGQVAAIYREFGLKVEILHSDLKIEERDRIEQALKMGIIDVVVQVQMLGEGYDLGTLSIAAVFRPFRSLSPYIQFVGRILRLADPSVPHSPGNKVYIVSHVGLNDERWWEDFSNFDKDDQDFFAAYLSDSEKKDIPEGEFSPRLSLRSFMKVLDETVSQYLKKGYLKQIDETMIKDFIATIQEKGYDPLEFGLTEEIIKNRLRMAMSEETSITPQSLLAQPQNVREARRIRLQQEARSIADTVITRLKLKHAGKNLVRYFPGKGETNSAILISLASGAQNAKMGLKSGERANANKELLQRAIDSSADIVDQLTVFVENKTKGDGK